MQFISNGPEIPNALLQAHEDDRVVFFCGAGISYPAGLPNFEGLVNEIYRICGTSLMDIERRAFERGQFDATLDLLERRLPGQRLAVRRALVTALQPKLRRKGAIETQAALLQLGRSRAGTLRLVTTNFDRVFHSAARRTKQAFQAYAAPMLPVPKNSRWDGLVYLHGLLPEKNDDTALHKLVITSGDFGIAYLTERWAARFVSELFRNYIVCFVGYSINDPVLRYMMDALAADRMLGEVTPQAWALGDCEPGQEHQKTIEWKAKGVTPILYETSRGGRDHSALHKTLHTWAEVYRDGVQGKEAIVVKHALARPQESTKQDDFVGRVLWALSDKSGLPAKRFADTDPAPPIDWLLDAFAVNRYGHGDLLRFDVPPRQEADERLTFSLISRPAPYDRAPRMMLFAAQSAESRWDGLMGHIARWLTRHLNDPRLILWIAQHDTQLHNQWVVLIEHQLDHLQSLENDGKLAELSEIRSRGANAIPDPLMRKLWNLLLSGRIRSSSRNFDAYRWCARLKREGLDTLQRLELREILAPKMLLKKSIRWPGEEAVEDDETPTERYLDWELVLACDHARHALKDMTDGPWLAALPELLSEIQPLLVDALDILRELGDADEFSDRSHWDMPSIEPHWQNRGFRDWVILIEILRDAWIAVHAMDESRAALVASNWFKIPYPTFKRLAFFAASRSGAIDERTWVAWLVDDDGRWLWSIETGREVYRLLVQRGADLSPASQQVLETTILQGPPRAMFRAEIDNERWEQIVSRSVWLHLAKLNASGLQLGTAAQAAIERISAAYPKWRIAPNERDEFSHWMSGTGDPDFDELRSIEVVPTKRAELVSWLKREPSDRGGLHEDNWQAVARTRFFHSLLALNDLAKEEVWPVVRWREALQTWSDESLAARSWNFASPIVRRMPDIVLEQLVHSVTGWMETASRAEIHHEDALLELCDRVLALPLADSGQRRDGSFLSEPVNAAINHPIGQVARTLINIWFAGEPNDNDLLPARLEPFFTLICDRRIDRFLHGRVILASRAIAFFRVDRSWTERNLLPLFDWDSPNQAAPAWAGFMWSPRLYQPLLSALKKPFLDSAKHYSEFGEQRQQYATFLTHVALGPTEGYSTEDFRAAISALPNEGLEFCARALHQALEGASDKREEFWIHRVKPLWQSVWPKSREFATSKISAELARVAITARNQFPDALTTVFDWIEPAEHPDVLVHLLYEAGLCAKFPNEALRFLNAVVGDPVWTPMQLGSCLLEIEKADPRLAGDQRFQRLSMLVQNRQY